MESEIIIFMDSLDTGTNFCPVEILVHSMIIQTAENESHV